MISWNNICKNFRTRTKKGKIYYYCILKGQETPQNCTKECNLINYKEYKKLRSNRLKIAKKSNKQKQLEDSRYSIIQDNLEICYFCEKERATEFHEMFKGRNRKKCIKWGLCVKVCRTCHERTERDSDFYKKYRIIAQNKWCDYYKKTVDEFIEEFGKNYNI